jgi:hypothetical protein
MTEKKPKELIILTRVISRLLAPVPVPVPGSLCFLGRSRRALSISCSFAFGHGKVESVWCSGRNVGSGAGNSTRQRAQWLQFVRYDRAESPSASRRVAVNRSEYCEAQV